MEEKTKLIRLCIPIPFSEPSLIKAEVTPAFSSSFSSILRDRQVINGFGRIWIAWIQQCVFVARMSILINGSPATEFNLEKRDSARRSPVPFSF